MLARAARMRKEPTEPERRLWMALRDSRLKGYKFRRQAVIGSRIVDFFCPARGLIVEVDGRTHDRETDLGRDAAVLLQTGFRTIRFTNEEVMRNFESVVLALLDALEREPERWGKQGGPPPQPPPLKRRGGNVAEAIRAAAGRLAATSDTARLDAEVLMAHALGVSRSDLLLRHQRDAVPEHFASLVERRMGHEPVAYIVGQQEFFGLSLRVSPAVLIPRGDSEVLVEAALAARPDARRVLDCGTGSGALLLAVLAGLAEARGLGIDRSARALAVAAGNAAGLGLAGRSAFLQRDWTRTGWQAGLGPFDLILANPPYVEESAPLAPSVRGHEPAGALFAGADGLDDYRVLVPRLPDLLTPGGAALVEIGASQAEAVGAIAARAGLAMALHRDLGGRPRVLELTRG